MTRVKLNCRTFFSEFFLEPNSSKLSDRNRKIALIYSIAIGLLTAGLLHLVFFSIKKILVCCRRKTPVNSKIVRIIKKQMPAPKKEQTRQEKIAELRQQILDINGLVKFKKEFAIGAYEDLAKFYKNLPNDHSRAKPAILSKITAINQQIDVIDRSKDPDKQAKLHILKKEVLKNLSDVHSVKTAADWKRELGANRKIWAKIVKTTCNHHMEQAAIKDSRRRIGYLSD